MSPTCFLINRLADFCLLFVIYLPFSRENQFFLSKTQYFPSKRWYLGKVGTLDVKTSTHKAYNAS
jgi:hypothetical protein